MNDATSAAVAAGLIVYYVVFLAVMIVSLVGLWKVFVKAGKPGWGAIVPFYNTYCLFLLILVPCVGQVMMIIMWIKLAQAFGKGAGFGIGILFLPFIFLPMLGFGDAQFIGSANR